MIDGTAADAAKLAVAGRTLPGGQGHLIFGEAESEHDQVRATFKDEDPSNAKFLDIVNDDFLTSGRTDIELPYAC